MNINALATRISALLRDQEAGAEFLTWDEPMVLDAIDQALGAIALHNPKEFITPHTITLVAGMLQPLPAGVKHVTVVGQPRPDGSRHTGFRERSADGLRRLQDSCLPCPIPSLFQSICPPVSGWQLQYWAHDDPSGLLVYPPVPKDDITRTLELTWLNNLHNGTDSPLAERYRPMVVHYALHVLFGADTESQSHQTKARDHLEAFNALLAVKGARG